MDEDKIRRLAAEAMMDKRTVAKFFRGERIYPLSEERLRAAAKRLRVKIGVRK